MAKKVNPGVGRRGFLKGAAAGAAVGATSIVTPQAKTQQTAPPQRGAAPPSAAQIAAERDLTARAGDGPSLVECRTYRYSGHSRADPAKYRPEGELDEWRSRDPIKVYRQRQLDLGVSEAIVGEIEFDARRKVDDATALCKAAAPPSLDLLMKDVYADGGSAWRN